MRRVAGLLAAVVVVLGIVVFASVRVIDGDRASASASPAAAGQGTVTAAAPAAPGTPTAGAKAATSVKVATTTKSYSLTAGGLKRSYEVIAPVTALPKSAPVIVMLSGIYSTVPQEISRDRLVNYAAADKAEIVYPVAFDDSWNAIGCCGKAAAAKVNDLAFLQALVPKVNPGHARPIYVVGYSNGTRMAYRVACDDPGLFDGYAMVKGLPTADCAIRKPVNIVQMASANDPEVPYTPGDKGSTTQVPVTTLVAQLKTAEKCPAASPVTHSGSVTLTTWSGCADGARLALAVWSGGVHSFPRPPGSVPAAAQVLWSFFTKTPLAPLPG
jgi:polyhydroxybutyrate depolymerase